MRSAVFFLLVSMLAAPLAAAPITYQGQLQQSGQLVDGGTTVSLTFRLFDQADEGSPIGELDESVTPQNGLFQVELDFGAGAFDGSPRYLEIQIVGEEEPLTPRQKITAVPSAQIALGVVDGAVGSAQIAVGAVGSAQIMSGAVGSTQMAIGSVGATQADSSEIQLRITETCDTGAVLVGVNPDGTVDCEALPSGPAQVLWVATSGDNTFSTLSAALASITDNSASTPYVVKIAPGVYSETGPVAMKNFVDVEGSGQGVTTLTCDCGGNFPGGFVTAGNITAEIRDLTINNTGGGGDSSIAVAATGAPATFSLYRITATAIGGTVLNIGVYTSGSPTMTNITATATGGNSNTGVDIRGGSPTMTNITATATGGTFGNNGVDIRAGVSPTIRGSVITGTSNSVFVSDFVAVRIADTTLNGLVGGQCEFKCVGVHNQNFVALSTFCT